jgi:hypothetical protein
MRIGRNLSLICLILLHGALARGQGTPPSLSNVSVQKEAGNSPDRYSGALTESYERRSAVVLQTSCAREALLSKSMTIGAYDGSATIGN